MVRLHSRTYHMQSVFERFICRRENVREVYYAVCDICHRDGTRSVLWYAVDKQIRGIRYGKTEEKV